PGLRVEQETKMVRIEPRRVAGDVALAESARPGNAGVARGTSPGGATEFVDRLRRPAGATAQLPFATPRLAKPRRGLPSGRPSGAHSVRAACRNKNEAGLSPTHRTIWCWSIRMILGILGMRARLSEPGAQQYVEIPKLERKSRRPLRPPCEKAAILPAQSKAATSRRIQRVCPISANRERAVLRSSLSRLVVIGFLTAMNERACVAEEPSGPAAPPWSTRPPLSDKLPPQACLRLGSTRLHLRGPAASVAFSPDGKLLVTTELGVGRVQFWDTASGLVREWPPGTATRVRFSPDGQHLITGGSESGMHLRCAATGESKRKLYDRAGHDFAFSKDGKRVLTTLSQSSGNNGSSAIALVDLETGAEIRRFPGFEGQNEDRLTVALSPNGKYAACAERPGVWGAEGRLDPQVIVWDAETGKRLVRLRPAPERQASCDDCRLVFTPDSKFLVVGGWEPVRVVEVTTGQV